tara:strand:+ start:3293 stop:3499 length:207 start_codon:yes stop_codon:yes gene_type:complete
MNYNANELRSFILSRELIDVRKLAEASGIPKLRLMNFLDNSQDLSDKHIEDLEEILYNYGYKIETVID